MPFAYATLETPITDVEPFALSAAPWRQLAVPLLEAETRCLPLLGPLLPLAVPQPACFGQASEAFPWPFAAYEVLTGRTGETASDAQRHAAAPALGAFLRVLHAITLPAPPPYTLARSDLGKRIPDLRARLGDLTPYEHVLNPLPHPTQPLRLCHGDLYCRHLLFDDGVLSGVIDWGDLHMGQ